MANDDAENNPDRSRRGNSALGCKEFRERNLEKYRCARIKRNGEPCGKMRRKGSRFCWAHGAKHRVLKTGRGLFKDLVRKDGTVRYKFLPKDFLLRYQEHIADPNKEDLGPDIAAIDALIDEETGQLHKGLTVEDWDIAVDLVKAVQRGDRGSAIALEQLFDLISRGAKHGKAKYNIAFFMEQRRKMVETNAKRRQIDMSTLSKAKAMMFLDAVIALVNDEISDEGQRLRFGQRLSQLLAIGGFADIAPAETAIAEGAGERSALEARSE